MTKKAFFSYLAFLLLLITFTLVKQHAITKRNQKEAITFYSSWKKDGKPVLVKKISKSDQETLWKMTVIKESENFYVGNVPKAVWETLSEKTPVLVWIQDKKVPASIVEIGKSVNFDSGMYTVKIKIFESGSCEKTWAELAINGAKDVVMLPYNALHEENNEFFVWTVKNNKAHKTWVQLKERSPKGISAMGIHEDEFVILFGSDTLKENDFVKEVAYD